MLVDDRGILIAGWDDELLSAELARLVEDGTALDGLGFDTAELNRLLALEAPAPGLTDEDAAPEPPATPVTRPADLWRLGDHRLLCGDATVAADVERLLEGSRPHLLITDPPYGVTYDPA